MSKPTGTQAVNQDTEQYILNKSFDPDYQVLAVEIVGENAAGTSLEKIKTVDGHLQVDVLSQLEGLSVPAHDYISASYNDPAFTETYVYKTGGSGGTTVATVVVVYTDATKDKLASITKT